MRIQSEYYIVPRGLQLKDSLHYKVPSESRIVGYDKSASSLNDKSYKMQTDEVQGILFILADVTGG